MSEGISNRTLLNRVMELITNLFIFLRSQMAAEPDTENVRSTENDSWSSSDDSSSDDSEGLLNDVLPPPRGRRVETVRPLLVDPALRLWVRVRSPCGLYLVMKPVLNDGTIQW